MTEMGIIYMTTPDFGRPDSLHFAQCRNSAGKSHGGNSRNLPALSSSCSTQRNPKSHQTVGTSFRDADPLLSYRDLSNTG